MVNLPSLSEVVEFSFESHVQLSSSSIQTSAPEIYPSTTTPSVSLYPSTVTDAEPVPPAPEQDKVKELFPAVEIVTASLPEVVLVPDQEPEAEQDEALVEDQVRVEVSVKRTDMGLAERLTTGAGVVGVESLPPPPPPPHPDISIAAKTVKNVFFMVTIYHIKK